MKDDWGTWKHVVEFFHIVLTVAGMMVLVTMVTMTRVLLSGPEWAAWPSIAAWGMAVFNLTGRWILPQGLSTWLQAKTNGTVKPATPP